MVRVLVGPNRYALQKKLDEARTEFIKKNGDLSIETIDAEDAELDDIRSALQSTSLFTQEKLVVVKYLGNNKQASEKVEEIISSVPDETQLLITEPQPDKRSSYYKTLKKSADVQEFAELDDQQLVGWLQSEAKKKNAVLSAGDARYLIDRTGANQSRLYSELCKLTDFTPQITRDSINNLVEENPRNTVFELLDATFAGNLQRASELYENLRISGSQPQVILAMIIWQMYQVALVASAPNKSIDEIARDTGAKPYSLQKSRRIAERLRPQKIKSILRDIQELDFKMKTQPVDPDIGLKNLLSKITS